MDEPSDDTPEAWAALLEPLGGACWPARTRADATGFDEPAKRGKSWLSLSWYARDPVTRPLALGVLLLAAIPWPAHADCPGERCEEGKAFDLGAFAFDPPTGELEREGAVVRRAIYSAAMSQVPNPAISFVQREGDVPRLKVVAQGPGLYYGLVGRMAPRAFEADVPTSVWDEIIARRVPRERDLAPMPPIPPPPLSRPPPEPGSPARLPPEGPPPFPMCFDGDHAKAEGAGPPGSAAVAPWPRPFPGIGCSDEEAVLYAEFLAEQALSILPQCAVVDASEDKHIRVALYRLSACLFLEGDTKSAGAVANALTRRKLRFAPDATLDWPGEEQVEGEAHVAARWRDKVGVSEHRPLGDINVVALIGQSVGHTVLHGFVSRDHPGLPYAAFEQDWRRIDGEMRITAIRVGAFQAELPPFPSPLAPAPAAP